MRKRETSAALAAEIEWAMGELCEHGTPRPEDMEGMRRALKAKSPMLHRRMSVLVDNASASGLSSESKYRLGALLVALDRHVQGQSWRLWQPDEWNDQKSSKADVIQIRCESAWKLKLQTYCQRSGQSASELIRRAVDAHLEGNPLWSDQDSEEEPN